MERAVRNCLTIGMCLALAGLLGASAQGDVKYWAPGSHGGGDATEWDSTANWDSGGVECGVPGPADHAIIHNFGVMPIIDSDVGQVNIVAPSWHAVTSALTVATGGSIEVLNWLILAQATGSDATLNVTGGSVVALNLELAYDLVSTAQVNLDAGTIEATNLIFGPGSANLDLEIGAELLLDGDQTADVSTWAMAGLLTAEDGTGSLEWDYDTTHTGYTTVYAAASSMTTIYTAFFEDGEINPGKLLGVENTTPYPAAQPAAFGQIDIYGWQNRGSMHLNGDTIIVDAVAAFEGENCAQMQNRVIRSDIELELRPNALYAFRVWIMVPEGNDTTFYNKVVMKDQTNGYMFFTEDGDITAPGENVWFSKTWTFDTTGYAHVGETIDFRFGIWLADSVDTWFGYTDNWSLSYVDLPEGFVDVTGETGLGAYTSTANDVSAAWGDFNADGWVDLYIGSLDYETAGLFQNESGTGFAPLPDAGPGANHPGLFVDYDNDGLLDLYTTQAGAHASHNDGDGAFTRIPGGFGGNLVESQSETATWADFDGDGYLDLYRVGWQPGGPVITPDDALYLSDAGTWLDLVWQGPAGDERYGRSATCADFDEDGDIDVYVSNYGLERNFLWANDGAANLTDVAEDYGVGGDDIPYEYEGNLFWGGFTIGSAWGDLDNDGHFDLVVGNFSHGSVGQDLPRFYRNMGPPTWHFEDMSDTVGMPFVESHASPTLGDFDNDGDLDVFITAVSGAYTGQQSTLMRNDGNWNFTDVSDEYGLRLASDLTNFMAAWADYDNDGDLDLLTARKLYRNYPTGASAANHWLKVKVFGNLMQGVNLDAVGTQVRIDLGGGTILTRQVETATGWGNQNDPTLHFGLGAVAGPVDLEIFWPNGETQVISGVAVDQTVAARFPGPERGSQDDIVVFSPPSEGSMWFGAHTQDDPVYFDDADDAGGVEEMVTTTTAGPFGLSLDIPMLGDVDGDGMDDMVVVYGEGGHWVWSAAHTDDSDSDGIGELSTDTQSGLANFGLEGDPVFLADVNDDGADDAITINAGMNWFCQLSTPGVGLDTTEPVQGPVQYGLPSGDTPHVGDFNGDGYADICVWRNTGGMWYIHLSDADGIGSGTTNIGQYGLAGDITLVGYINNDSRCDAMIVRDDGTGLLLWQAAYADSSGTVQYGDGLPPYVSNIVRFGLPGDTPFLADVNGDGKDDIGVYRVNAATGRINWFVGFTSIFGALGNGGGNGDDNGDYGIGGLETPIIGNLDTENDRDDIVLRQKTEHEWLGSHTQPAPEYLDGVQDMGTLVFGGATDLAPLLGDVNGDGVDDLVVRSDSGPDITWHAAHSVIDVDDLGDFSDVDQSFIGAFGDSAMVIEQFLGDVNGDGAADAISVNSDFEWTVAFSFPGVGLGGMLVDGPFQFGMAGDIPLVGDFDGDGFTDICVYRPVGGHWFVSRSTFAGLGYGGDTFGQLGGFEGDVPMVGDINGDGRTDGLILRDGEGTWVWQAGYADENGRIDWATSHSSDAVLGLISDTPFIADINGDNKDDIGVWRDGTATWFVTFTLADGDLGNNPGGDDSAVFGQPGDIPLIGDFGDFASQLCPGDLNCDGEIDFDDIDPFVEALAGEANWPYPDCPWLNGDCNGDGTVGFDDIDPFVPLIGTSCGS